MVRLIRTLDTNLLVSTYTRYYPLLQTAYEDLEHPPQYFNDRVIEVIDHLLTTPDLQRPVALSCQACNTICRSEARVALRRPKVSMRRAARTLRPSNKSSANFAARSLRSGPGIDRRQ